MSPDQEHRLEEIFSAARNLPPRERTAFLERACGGDAELRRQADSLLTAHEQAGQFLKPTVAIATPNAPVEKPGDRIGRYKLLEQIGEGGFGVVWMAEQEEPVRRRVALKIIKLGMDTREVVARFEAERQALAMMDHANIASVFDGGATDTGRPYFVMELVKGIPITQFCDERKLTTRERLGLFMQVCQAVQHAHQKGVIHRDLKPTNILVTVKDDRPVPKVIDFGVAKATQARLTEKTLFTRFQQWIGTPAYMSPEQAGLGSLDVDTRSDVYSLGVLLYELLTGRPPFDTKKLMEAGYDAVMRTIREDEPPKPSTRLSTLADEELNTVAAQRGSEPAKLGRLVHGELDWIVMKALEKDRTRRYETANALGQDIQRHLGNEPVLARPPSNVYRLQKMVHRNKLFFAAGGVVSASLVLGLGISTVLFFREKEARKHAVMAEQQAKAAQAQETVQREKATAKAQESLDRLVRLQNANGISRLEEDELAASLPWFTEALGAVQGQPEQEELQRIRINSVLLECPKPIQMLFHNGPVTTAHFSRDGRQVATASRDHTARIWDTSTGKPVGIVLQHTGIVWQAVFSADGRRVVTASADGTARVWDAETGRPISPPLSHQGPVVSAVISPNGKLVATASEDRTARLWDAESGAAVAVLRSHNQAVRHVAFSPDSALVATGADDAKVWVWRTSNGTRISPIYLAHSGPITALHFNGAGNHLMASSRDGSARVWNVERYNYYVCPVINHNGPVLHSAFSPDGGILVTACGTGVARAYDVRSAQPKSTELLHRGAIHWVEFDSENRRVVTASADRTAGVWDARTGELIVRLRHGGAVRLAEFSADGRFVLTACDDGAVRIWPLPSTQALYRRVRAEPPAWRDLAGPEGTVRVVRDERQTEVAAIASALPGGAVTWRIQHAGTIRAAAFSPDGRRLATGSDDQTARVSSAETGKAVSPPLEHRAPVWGLAFSADGRLLATATADGSIRVWDAATGEPLTPSLRHDGPTTDVVFSKDGRSLSAGGESGPPQSWDLTPTQMSIQDLSGLAELLAGRRLDDTKTSLEPSPTDRMMGLWDSVGKKHFPALVAETAKTFETKQPTNKTSVAIPARDPRTSLNQLDLTYFYNAALTQSWQTPESESKGDLDLSELPRGLVEFGGITFDARGIVQVSGQSMKAQGGNYPEQIKGIPVNRKCQRIHFLHGTGWGTTEGVEIGSHVIQYADGQRRVLPLVHGQDVRDWYFFQSLPVTSREARLVWIGANKRTRVDGAHLRLYLRSWENPAPDVEITSIDFVSAMTACAPFIIAITVNDQPVKCPDVQVEHARQEEQAQAASREVSQAVMQGNYEQALRRLEEKWKSDQTQFGATNAHTLQTLRQLIDLTGCLADWARCVEFARRYTELSGHDPLVARDCAVAALLAGDEQTYRDVCQHMVTRYAKTTDAIKAEQTAKICFLATNALADLGPALRLVQMAVDSATNNLWFRLAQGMAEFRSGQAEAAIQWLEPARTANELHVAILAGYVASLAHHRLGASERARAALTNANARFDAFLQPGSVTGGGWDWWWFDPAASMALRLEAEKTVLGQPVWAKPTVASLAATRKAWLASQREARAPSER